MNEISWGGGSFPNFFYGKSTPYVLCKCVFMNICPNRISQVPLEIIRPDTLKVEKMGVMIADDGKIRFIHFVYTSVNIYTRKWDYSATLFALKSASRWRSAAIRSQARRNPQIPGDQTHTGRRIQDNITAPGLLHCEAIRWLRGNNGLSKIDNHWLHTGL